MSLPIILAILLTAAILAWGAVYLVVRQRREAAVRKMFQADPMDAEIGREALRRVFGILTDEDPPAAAPIAIAAAAQIPPPAPAKPPAAAPTPAPIPARVSTPLPTPLPTPIPAPLPGFKAPQPTM